MLGALLIAIVTAVGTAVPPPPSDGLPPPKVAMTSGPRCKCPCGSEICRCASMGGCLAPVKTAVKTVEQPITRKDAYYPVRGSLWRHPGPIKSHLKSGEHAGKFDHGYIEDLEPIEAESLHSDDHENRVKWQYVSRPGEYAVMTDSLKEKPKKRKAVFKTQRYRVCNGGSCQWFTRQVFSHYEWE